MKQWGPRAGFLCGKYLFLIYPWDWFCSFTYDHDIKPVMVAIMDLHPAMRFLAPLGEVCLSPWNEALFLLLSPPQHKRPLGTFCKSCLKLWYLNWPRSKKWTCPKVFCVFLAGGRKDSGVFTHMSHQSQIAWVQIMALPHQSVSYWMRSHTSLHPTLFFIKGNW